jgi:hypothetical protein
LDLHDFICNYPFHEFTHFQRFKYISFFYTEVLKKPQFTFDEIKTSLEIQGYPIKNLSYLKNQIKKSRDFITISTFTYSLSPKCKVLLAKTINLSQKTPPLNTIANNGDMLLDENVFSGQRGFITPLVEEINWTYKYGKYNSCAVMMRRVFEIILILSFEENDLSEKIQDSKGNYMQLKNIVNIAKVHKNSLKLSRDVDKYNQFRELGNLGAHKIRSLVRKNDIDNIIVSYRHALEELYRSAKLLR